VLLALLSPRFGCEACGLYAHPYVWYFLFCIALFYPWRALNGRLQTIPVVLCGVPILLGSYVIQAFPDASSVLSGYPVWILPAVIVGAALLRSAGSADFRAGPVLLVGDASYAVYLTHATTMVLLPRYLPWWYTNVWAALATVVICLLTGILVHLLIEKPL